MVLVEGRAELEPEACETVRQLLLALATPRDDGQTRWAKLLASTVLTQTNLPLSLSRP